MEKTRPTPEQMIELERMAASQPAILRDVTIVGTYLSMVLAERGMDEDSASEWGFILGRACFGRAPWEAFDLVLAKVVGDADKQQKMKLWASTPFEQVVPEPSKLLTEFFDYARSCVGDEGVFPQPMFVQREGLTIEALAVDGGAVFKRGIEHAGDSEVTEMVFSVDMSSRPDQGLEFDDFLGVVWLYEGQLYSGVINYETGEGNAFRPIDWHNDYWNHSLHDYPIAKMKEARDES